MRIKQIIYNVSNLALMSLMILQPLSLKANDTFKDKSRPWEINNDVESYLPDMFYNSDYQNEQIMSMTVGSDKTDPNKTNRKYAIDHVIYPTLGNPNLYVRNEADYEDDLTVVLRVEDKLFQELAAGKSATQSEASNPWEKSFDLKSGEIKEKIFFKLIPKSVRLTSKEQKTCNTNGVDSGKSFTISPTKMIQHLHPTELGFQSPQFTALDYDGSHSDAVGKNLSKKTTVEFKFNKADLTEVCQGMYDLKVNSYGNFTETQMNSVRVFSEIPNKGNYSVINITDTQVTVEYKGKRNIVIQGVDDPLLKLVNKDLSEKKFEEMTHQHLLEFVKYINEKVAEGTDPQFKNAAFISFNGDLHDGGSPLTIDPAGVADTYNREATAVINALSGLSLPIVLTAGNHDGYVTMLSQYANQTKWREHLSAMFSEFGESYRYGMEVGSQADKLGLNVFPIDFNLLTKGDYKMFPSVLAPAGGNHLDIFSGKFVRDVSRSYEGWQGVSYDKANVPLFDGFNQWRKTYGPLYTSFRFGKNYFININSYDLRQHRRTGWGMYTVNYGGNVSPFQMDWIARQIQKAESQGLDIVMLAHHDPRGGHRGKDFPYNFRQIEFEGAKDSFFNYIKGEVLNPQVCKLPDDTKPVGSYVNCMHDGLQEWMRPDNEFDCPVSEKDPLTRVCHDQRTKPTNYFSGYALLKLVNNSTNLRTLLFGHTHYNSVEVKYGSDQELIPTVITIDAEQRKRLMAIEHFGILRNNVFLTQLSKYKKFLDGKLAGLPEFFKFGSGDNKTTDNTELPKEGVTESEHENMWSYLSGESKEVVQFDLKKLGFVQDTNLKGNDRELVVLRMTSGVDLADQEVEGQPMIGFSVFNFNNNDSQDQKKLNEVTYYQWRKASKLQFWQSDNFQQVGTMALDRKASLETKRLEELIAEKTPGFTHAED